MTESDLQPVEEIWVNVTEGAQKTGYNRNHVMRVARKIWGQPEDQRRIKIRRRTTGYELWLPDLVKYVKIPGHGPQRKRK
jgi:hypothetical protein